MHGSQTTPPLVNFALPVGKHTSFPLVTGSYKIRNSPRKLCPVRALYSVQCTVPYSTIHYNTVQYSTMHSTVQYTLQYSVCTENCALVEQPLPTGA